MKAVLVSKSYTAMWDAESTVPWNGNAAAFAAARAVAPPPVEIAVGVSPVQPATAQIRSSTGIVGVRIRNLRSGWRGIGVRSRRPHGRLGGAIVGLPTGRRDLARPHAQNPRNFRHSPLGQV